MPKIVLIDGNAYIHRAYHALPPMTTSAGTSVNAVYGFTRLLLKVRRSEKPDCMAVCFDAGVATFRHHAFAEYKANRKKTDDDLKSQIPLAHEAARALGIPNFVMPGYEADDIIATLAKKAADAGAEVVIVTGDKDALQLAGGNIRILNESKNILYDRDEVYRKYGLYPEQLRDMFALMGDTSDNIPGIKGIGEKTAVKLIAKYGSLESVLDHAAEVGGKTGELLAAGREDALKSRMLVTLCFDVPLPQEWSACVPAEPDREQLVEFLQRMEFKSLMNELAPQDSATALPIPEVKTFHAQTHTVLTREDLDALIHRAAACERMAMDVETDSLDPFTARLVGFSCAFDTETGYYIPVGHRYIGAPEQLPRSVVLEKLTPILQNPRIPKYGHNLKFDISVLAAAGIHTAGIACDTMLASYCLNPSRMSHGLKNLSAEILGVAMTQIDELIGTGKNRVTMDEVQVEKAAPYAAADAVAVLRLAEVFQPQMKKENLSELFSTVEMPLVDILCRMESMGMKIDRHYLEDLGDDFAKKLGLLETELNTIAGTVFNPNSPKQLSVILFDQLKLPVIRKTKTGNSTDEEVLRQLSSQHPLPAKVIEYRELQKLKSTYIDSLLEKAEPLSDRVHTSFNQAVTATGRLSSSDPNLQNIPIRTEYGRRIRAAFVPADGFTLVSADYSQIDLRALAHISGDTALIEAFRRGDDIHSATAREVFGLGAEEVPDDLRRIAKSINFGIVYGMSAYSLSQQLEIPAGKAKEYIDSYFARYAGVRRWMDEVVVEARKKGFVTTLLGRIRYLPDINASNGNVRGFAERMALNTPIQGTSADIIKRAMIDIDKAFHNAGSKSRMLVQVHDELLFEAPVGQLAAECRIIRHCMEKAVTLSVPLVAEISAGKNWNDMETVEVTYEK